MNNISVIGTVHTENGLCNSSNLFKLLEVISPQIIFLEAPSDLYKEVLAGKRRESLEIHTARKYQLNFQVELIPIDVEGLPNLGRFRKMRNTFEQNLEYQRASKELFKLAFNHGFQILNTKRLDQISDYIEFVESQIVKVSNMPEFTNDYNE